MKVSLNTETLRSSHAVPAARTVIVGAGIVLFIVLCVLPVFYMFAVSLTDASGTVSFDNYRELFSEPRRRELLWTSTLLAGGAALLATLLGVPLGLVLARCPLPAKHFLRIALVVPLVVPPYVLALAWILVSGPSGLLGANLFSAWTYSLTGAVIVLGLGFYPLSMLATEAAARRVDARLEEAALLVANPHRVLWQITLRLIAPTIAATALIIFVLALSEFGVPALLRVRVFTTEVFTAFAALYDFGAGVALATPLLAVALVVSIAVKLITGERLLVTRRTMHPALIIRPGALRIFLLIGIVIAIFISTVLPLGALLAETKTVGRIILAGGTSAHAIANSLWLASLGATLIVTLALVLGYGRARARTRFRHLFDPTLLLIFAVPSTVLGIGLIGLWNREGLAGQIYSSQGMILIAYLARLLPVAVLMLAASVQQVPVSTEEAAEVAGATWTRRFIGILLPQLWSGLAATWIVSFIFCFGELGATLLVAPPGESTLPVRVYTLIANTPLSEVASLALLQVSITLLPLVLLALLFRKRKTEMA